MTQVALLRFSLIYPRVMGDISQTKGMYLFNCSPKMLNILIIISARKFWIRGLRKRQREEGKRETGRVRVK